MFDEIGLVNHKAFAERLENELLDAVLENPELNKKESLLSLAFAADKKLL